MTMTLLTTLNEQLELIASVEASVIPNTEALMEGFPVDIPLIVEDAARTLSNISIKVGSGHQGDAQQEINFYTAFRILATPINRNVVNVNPPLFKLLVSRVGQDQNVDHALNKLAGHPEFQNLRREIAAKFQKAADDVDAAKELAAEIDKLRVGYDRLVDKLKGLGESVRLEVEELVALGNGVGGTRITGSTSVRDPFNASMARSQALATK